MRISGYSNYETGRQTSQPPPARTKAPAAESTDSSQSLSRGSFAAATSQSTSTELKLTTAEGDKVTLSFSSGSTRAAATDGTDYASIRNRESEVKIQVEGDLNQDELKDITKLAKLLSGAANDLLKGHTGQAARRIGKANELESIQNFAFSLNQRVDYRYNYEQSGGAAQQ